MTIEPVLLWMLLQIRKNMEIRFVLLFGEKSPMKNCYCALEEYGQGRLINPPRFAKLRPRFVLRVTELI
jgi:hypothetical protein